MPISLSTKNRLYVKQYIPGQCLYVYYTQCILSFLGGYTQKRYTSCYNQCKVDLPVVDIYTYTLRKKGSKGVIRLSPQNNYFWFHVEPSVEMVLHLTQQGYAQNQRGSTCNKKISFKGFSYVDSRRTLLGSRQQLVFLCGMESSIKNMFFLIRTKHISILCFLLLST